MIRSDVGDQRALWRTERRSSSLVGTVAVAAYAHPDEGARQRLARPRLEEIRVRFARTVREELGFGEGLPLDGGGSTRQELWAGLESFLAVNAARRVLYWTGHGVHRADGGYYLACSDSWQSGEFRPERAVSLVALVDRLLRPGDESHTLLVVDACSSHGYHSLNEALRHALDLERSAAVYRARETRSGGFAVIGTSGADTEVPEGRWVQWLQEALAKPDFVAPDQARPFEPSALYLPLPYLRDAVDAEAAAAGLDDPAQRPGYIEVRALPNSFLDNPYYRALDHPEYRPAVMSRRTPWIEAEQFGLEHGSHLTRHFAGRRDALSRIVRWMETHPKGLLAVTGLAGTGKTALLGRLALTSLPSRHETLGPALDPATLPRPGTVHAALSCTGQSAHSLAASLREVLSQVDGAPPLPEDRMMSKAFTDALGELVERAGSVNLLFDALDEALPDQAHDIARQLLNPLSALPGVRVIVGTRAQPRRRTTAAVEESLLDTLEQSVEPVVLRDDAEARAGITGMALSVLDADRSPYRGDGRPAQDRAWTAETIAARSQGSFLVARLVAAGLARRARIVPEADLLTWIRGGGMDLRRRLAEETGHLERQPGAGRAREVLRALAVIQGAGLTPDPTWLTLADALRDDGTPELTLDDLRQVCRSADGGIVATRKETGPDATGRVRYQLAHPSYGEFFLDDARLSAQEAHRKVVGTLRTRAGSDWSGAGDYTFAYLGAHAAQVGPQALRELFDDVRFLMRTDPDVMLPLAAGLARDCDGAALYGRVAGSFPRTPSPPPPRALLARKALTSATAFVSHREATYRTLRDTDGFLPWQEYWTDVWPAPAEWRRAAPVGGARALSWRTGTAGAAASDTLTAGGVGEIQVLHPESGARLLTRRLPRSGDGRSGILSEVREVGAGPRWATVARDDQAVYFWRAGARAPDQEFRWGGTVRALATAETATETVALAADGSRIWLWFWKSGMQQHGTHLADIRTVDVRHLAALTLGTRLFVLAAGESAELFEVDRRVNRVGGLHPGHLAVGVLDYPALAAAAVSTPATATAPEQGWLAVSDGQRVHVWRCETDGGTPGDLPEPVLVAQYHSKAQGLAFGRHDGELLLAGYEDVVVRIWSVGESGRETAFQLDAPRQGAMAFEPGGRGLLAVADGPDIRFVDAVAALESGHQTLRRPSNERPAVALAPAPGGPPLLCRTWGDRVRVSRPERDAPASGPVTELTHDRMVTAVDAARVADGWAVAAAAGRTVRLWRLGEDLGVLASRDIALGGDAGQPARALSLLADPDGATLRLSVPDERSLTLHDIPVGTGNPDGSATARIRTDSGFCGIDARIMTDGTHWLAGDLGDQLRVWRGQGDGTMEQRLRMTATPSCLALGELYDAEDAESLPLLAWADGGSVYVKDCSGEGLNPPRRLEGYFPAVTSLLFAGPVERPVLLLCDERTISPAWDVWSGNWLDGPGIPSRGYDVHAVDTAPDGEGLVVALQGRDRCDLIRLPDSFFTTVPGREPVGGGAAAQGLRMPPCDGALAVGQRR
ncbi:peptidase C14 caspase catalytic subunit p20 [Streptomyces sp. NPDC004610]|uniref:peptidase C14 caspase catalytic subunit p20 n=1 Tax=unclassified Streptomyces TaxID=2593676 RepID=UPI0033AA71A0